MEQKIARNVLFVLLIFFFSDSETLTIPRWSEHVETFNGKTFHLIYEPLLPWIGAVQACKEKNLVLAKTNSVDELKFLVQLVKFSGNGRGRAWIGGTKLNQSGYVWIENGKAVPSSIWSPSEPNNSGGKETCTEIWGQLGGANDLIESTFNPFICSLPDPSPGYVQEIYLYEGDNDDSDFHVFRESIQDLSEWPFFRKKSITKICSRGAWIFYKEKNFKGFVFGNYSHTLSPSNCQVKREGIRFPLEESLSLRFVGAKNTSQESVSFFTEEYFQGVEYTTDPLNLTISGINETINSIVFTGYSNWTFFEDNNFNGSDRCFENKESRVLGSGSAVALRPKDIDFYGQNPLIQSRLRTVGSASNNCPCRTEIMIFPI